MKRNLCMFLVLLLLFTQEVAVFAAEDMPPTESDTTLDSGVGTPSDAIPWPPLEPGTPTEPSTPAVGETLPQTDSGLAAPPTEITRLYKKELLLRAHCLTSGDTEAFQNLQELIDDTLSRVCGIPPDEEQLPSVEAEHISWDAVDINTPGEYTVTLLLQFTQEYRDAFYMSDKTRTLTFPVTVVAPQTLGLVFSEITTSTISLLIAPAQTASPNLWYAEVPHGETPNATAWRLDNSGEIGYTSFLQLTVHRAKLTLNKDYHIRIEQGGLVSNPYILDCAVFTEDTDLDDGSGGDRDGNDTDDDTVDPPDLEQTPPPPPPTTLPADQKSEQPLAPPEPQEPSPPVKPAPPLGGVGAENAPEISEAEPESSTVPTTPQEKPRETSPPQEIVTHDSLTISGARLAWMLRSGGDTVPFGWNGISIEIPAAFIEGLSLEAEEMLSLTMVKNSDEEFTVTIFVDNVPLAAIAPTTVWFATAKQMAAPTLFLDENRLDTPVRYENGCAVFSIDCTGSYRLAEDTPATTAPTQQPISKPVQTVLTVSQPPKPAAGDFLPVSIVGLMCAIAAILWMRRKRR